MQSNSDNPARDTSIKKEIHNILVRLSQDSTRYLSIENELRKKLDVGENKTIPPSSSKDEIDPHLLVDLLCTKRKILVETLDYLICLLTWEEAFELRCLTRKLAISFSSNSRPYGIVISLLLSLLLGGLTLWCTTRISPPLPPITNEMIITIHLSQMGKDLSKPIKSSSPIFSKSQSRWHRVWNALQENNPSLAIDEAKGLPNGVLKDWVLGVAFARQGEVDFSATLLKSAIDKADTQELKAAISLSLAELSLSRGDFQGTDLLLTNVLEDLPLEGQYKARGLLAFAKLGADDIDGAEVQFENLLLVSKNIFGMHSNEYASVLNFVGMKRGGLGQEEKAIGYFESALDIYNSVPASDLRNREYVRKNLGIAMYRVGKYFEALEYLKTAAEALEELAIDDWRILGDDPDNIAHTYGYAGQAALQLSDLKEAERLFRKNLMIRERNGNLPLVGLSLINLAETLIRQGRYEEAQALLERAVPLNKEHAERAKKTQELLESLRVRPKND